MKMATRRMRTLAAVALTAGILFSSTGCIRSRVYNDVAETSVKTVAATLLDLIVINWLEKGRV